MKKNTFFSAFCALLFTNILVGANAKDIEGLVRKCQTETGYRKDCRKLYDTVRGLTDQTLLAKIAVEDKDPGVRSAAVGELTDQALLAKFAVEDKKVYVRLAAVEKLRDQAALAKIAEKEEDRFVRAKAIAAMDESNLANKRLAGDLGASTSEAGESIARMRLATQEPRIRDRLPRVVFAASVSPTNAGYRGLSQGEATIQGESVSFFRPEPRRPTVAGEDRRRRQGRGGPPCRRTEARPDPVNAK